MFKYLWTILKVAAPSQIPMNLLRGATRRWNHVLQSNRPVLNRVGYFVSAVIISKKKELDIAFAVPDLPF